MNDVTKDEIALLAYVVEYECHDKMQPTICKILEKIENNLHIDAQVGHRLSEYGRIMGWSKE